jgi:methionyl aminopeptidase
MGFPKSVCISVNEVLVHGIPSTRVLESGDSLNADVSVFVDGYHGDNNMMIEIGEVHPEVKRVIETARRAVYEAIKICRPGQKFNMIGKTI